MTFKEYFAFLKPAGLDTAAKAVHNCEAVTQLAAYSTNAILLKQTIRCVGDFESYNIKRIATNLLSGDGNKMLIKPVQG